MVLERRALRVVAPERRRRLGAPGREARRDAVGHEVVEPLDRAGDRRVDRLEPVRPGHLDPGDEVRDHVARAEDLGGVEDPPVPLLPADVALLPGADDREQALVPDLVVRVVDRDPVVAVALHRLARKRLRHDLADPASGEALLDRLRVAAVEVGLLEPVDLARHGAARERVGVARLRGVVLVDDREGLEDVLDRLHAGVGAAGLLVLAPVVVDVAEAALLLGAEVLAEPQHGQVDQVAPLDRRRRLHHRLAVRERVAVVLGHRRRGHVGDEAALERELGADDAIRRLRVHADGDDRAPQAVRPARQRELFGRPPQRGLAQLGERLLVEREDEVGLGLDRAVEVVAERRLVEGDAGAQQVLLEHGLRRHGGHALDQRLDEGATAHAVTGSSWTKRSSGTRSSSPAPCAISRNVYRPARSRGPKR